RRGAQPDGLPRLHPFRPPDASRGDERAPARDGGDAAVGPVQPRTADLCGAETLGYREAVRPAMTLDLSDPWVLAAGAAGILALLLLLILHAALKSARVAAPLAGQMVQLGQRVQALSDGQQHLA